MAYRCKWWRHHVAKKLAFRRELRRNVGKGLPATNQRAFVPSTHVAAYSQDWRLREIFRVHTEAEFGCALSTQQLRELQTLQIGLRLLDGMR